MSTDPDTILLEAEEQMEKAVAYLKHEFQGLRAGRATTSLVDYIKVDCYGSPTDLKSVAAVSIPEPSQILIKPFDATILHAIKAAIETSGLGLNPNVEAKQIRLNIPTPTSERRQQLVAQAKKMTEEQKIIMRNARRDANKHADALAKQDGVHHSEDDIKVLKTEIQDLLKKYEAQAEELVKKKSVEIMEV